MKYLLTLLVMLTCAVSCLAEPQQATIVKPTESMSPEAIVDVQIAAYNKGDIEAFIGTFAQDVKTYRHPNTLDISGIENLKKAYAGYFKEHPELHAKVTGKIIQGNFVIYHELVSGIVGGKDFFATAIYEIRNGKIQNIWFL